MIHIMKPGKEVSLIALHSGWITCSAYEKMCTIVGNYEQLQTKLDLYSLMQSRQMSKCGRMIGRNSSDVRELSNSDLC
jgi:hypothetical protein